MLESAAWWAISPRATIWCWLTLDSCEVVAFARADREYGVWFETSRCTVMVSTSYVRAFVCGASLGD